MVVEVKSFEEYTKLINGDKVVVVDWFATWCGPCKVISPVFAELSNEFTNVVFVKVDVDEVPEAAEGAGIRAMPTFQFYQAGKKVDEIVGANPAKLKETIAKYN
ncbi:thioredoxin [Rhizoclosmatium globosum]|uniref:Thioredoxin n=1 Tax=Rhizoclosmatium globosum TaxID=329046 RepID=A0A1Y2CU09_9FUNG|nr:thioredoxin [Rhizoclosmatium globosum]|eukprot:ORY49825.1 thioredoxin [Rhizoclosmatium globosum]